MCRVIARYSNDCAGRRGAPRAFQLVVIIAVLVAGTLSVGAHDYTPTPTPTGDWGRPGETYTPTATPTRTRTPRTPTPTPGPPTVTLTPTNTPRRLTIRVPQDAPTIQTAIDYAVDYDTIIVSPGVYYENLRFRGQNITLQGTNLRDWNVVANTIIDGGSRDSVITLNGNERDYATINRFTGQPTTRIEGLTIRNGSAEYGGGINGASAGVTLNMLIIRDNHATMDGGGIYRQSGNRERLWISSTIPPAATAGV
ncbi:hypothetical protein HS125_13690 [bacterium]|nr:hypothetical protein [bacterium]